MLHNGQYGKSLVSEEFNQMCIDNHVEATIQAFPNPGSLQQGMRLITFRNFNDTTVKVTWSNKMQMVPAKGTLQVLLPPDEPLPNIERMEDNAS